MFPELSKVLPSSLRRWRCLCASLCAMLRRGPQVNKKPLVGGVCGGDALRSL